jgi:hypothetical protein
MNESTSWYELRRRAAGVRGARAPRRAAEAAARAACHRRDRRPPRGRPAPPVRPHRRGAVAGRRPDAADRAIVFKIRIECLRWYPVTVTNSSRIRNFSSLEPARYLSPIAFRCGLHCLGLRRLPDRAPLSRGYLLATPTRGALCDPLAAFRRSRGHAPLPVRTIAIAGMLFTITANPRRHSRSSRPRHR